MTCQLHLHALAICEKSEQGIIVHANFGDEMSVPLFAGCDISIWRARLGEGESNECVVAGPGGVGDNVPCDASLTGTDILTAHFSPEVLTAPPTEFVPTLGGSGGGAMTHAMHYLRQRVGPGDSESPLTKVESERPSVTKNVYIRQLPRDYAPSLIPLSPSSRFSYQTAPDAGLPSADEQFLARVRQIYSTFLSRPGHTGHNSPSSAASNSSPESPNTLKSQKLSMYSPGLPTNAYKWHFGSRSHDSARTPPLLQCPPPSGVVRPICSREYNVLDSLTMLRDMLCAGTLARIGLLMEHRTVVMSKGRDTDNVS
ncbi:hypothetical protein EDB86DRAFT_2835971 [Lactarius hatsudake]|nr:hypothetical protein EDB86DRAFT_2835971 [Lactarius hatsudake]